jgi:hypothetical protein
VATREEVLAMEAATLAEAVTREVAVQPVLTAEKQGQEGNMAIIARGCDHLYIPLLSTQT